MSGFGCEFSKMEKILMNINFYSFCNFFKNWIFSTYYWKNLLFRRYDRIKVPQIKPYEYCDISMMMLYANFELIVKFIEEEEPEKYICWYKDENGNEVGHKYGENTDFKHLFPEYNGKYIMDIIKEIYNFWKFEYVERTNDNKYLLRFWSDNFFGRFVETSKNESGDGFYEHDKDAIAKEEKDLKGEINWQIIEKYMDRSRIFEKDYVHDQYNNLEKELEDKCRKYLHLCLEVRPYLWT